METLSALGRFRDSRPLLSHHDALRAEADGQGYLLVSQTIPIEDVLSLRRSVLEVCGELGWLDHDAPLMDGIAARSVQIGDYRDPLWVELQRRILPSPEFAAVAESAQLLGILEALYAGPVQGGKGSVVRVFSPNSADLTTPAHQDHFYTRGSEQMWTVWVPLGDCPVELGGLSLIPGSHRHGLLGHEGDNGARGVPGLEDAEWVAGDFACGDLLMFNCLTVHRALPNFTANRLRLSVDFRFEPA
ncbi:MAG: phytanoyl-CoA dioxygenase family protein [Fimbriimonas ginsengisoli]|uniref:Phytanoyl-CoA dioxygenase family protein n=1 Tax=Fimbriimonas ginsengisoli TaxID=1005039 RepID=A0A931PU62_FIMGI|nr:phytanoyl-CoA dioxygenase family protein [Fimbriimonas ginsengisoli]